MLDDTRDLALVFAGGNAVGAYHAGTYEALHGHGLRPDWVVGASIGAVISTASASGAASSASSRVAKHWVDFSVSAFRAFSSAGCRSTSAN